MAGGYGMFIQNSRKNKMGEWMEELLKSEFFGTICLNHKDIKKNEVNRFCIDCRKCICQHCISSSSPHFRHRNLQIRRYVYQNVVRIDNIQKYVNCSHIQQYVLNGGRAIFLNTRAQVKPAKPSNNGAYCKVCDRSLVDIQNQYCCIACKISDCGDISLEKCSLSYPINQFDKISKDLDHDDLNDDSRIDADSNGKEYMLDKYGLKPKKKLHKRKGIPIRAPFY